MHTQEQITGEQYRARKIPATPTGSPSILRPLGHAAWPTATRGRLRHTVYSLIGCPPVVGATYILVRRDAGGQRAALAFRRTLSKVASINLARIRKAGARLGANEVHIYEGAAGGGDAARVVKELKAGSQLNA